MTEQNKIEDLKLDLQKARDDLEDAQERIKKIEEALWGRDPKGMTPDPDAMINILRDIRGKMPDLQCVADDSKFAKRALQTLFGSGGVIAIGMLIWQVAKAFQ